MAEREQLPVDPLTTQPPRACDCGAHDFAPEPDVMDTWATSSCTPLILGRWPDDPDWFAGHFPASLRPQAHDIIRTWAFYSIVKALYHTGELPWREVMVSGHGLSAERRKISKSREHSEVSPGQVIERESADALRYWATASRTGADTPFTLETIATGRRLVTKLWNAGRFAQVHLAGFTPSEVAPPLAPTDRWLLARLARAIERATDELEAYEYAAARAEVERFFWADLCDNYLELAKSRLYGAAQPDRDAARWTLYHALLATLKLLAPYLPYITEELYLGLFGAGEGSASIHRAPWPRAREGWADAPAEEAGEALIEGLRLVRRYKAEQGLSVGAPLAALRLAVPTRHLAAFQAALADLGSATRAATIALEAGADLQLPVIVAVAEPPEHEAGARRG